MTPRIFATLAYGFDPEQWGALGFSNEGVRDKLAAALRSGPGLVLTMGTAEQPTPDPLQGRLLALHELGTRALATAELVEPAHWRRHLDENGGKPRWPYGLPILAAERFEPMPLRAQLLPRLHAQNLHQKLASNFEELTGEEVARVLAQPRVAVTEIWSSPVTAFVSGLTRPPKGPRPAPGERILSSASGPAATYCMELVGSSVAQVAGRIAPAGSQLKLYKVGFSNDPDRRRRELNAYLPDPMTLEWAPPLAQWHADEINAWAMEQAVFEQLLRRGARHVKGEILAAKPDVMSSAWSSATMSTRRPLGSVSIKIGNEEAPL